MPLVNYRASAEGFLREIHEVAGHRASAKQTLIAMIHDYIGAFFAPLKGTRRIDVDASALN